MEIDAWVWRIDTGVGQVLEAVAEIVLCLITKAEACADVVAKLEVGAEQTALRNGLLRQVVRADSRLNIRGEAGSSGRLEAENRSDAKITDVMVATRIVGVPITC